MEVVEQQPAPRGTECVVCANVLVWDGIGRPPSKYCSKKCKEKGRAKRSVTRAKPQLNSVCLNCGKSLAGRHSQTMYCDNNCKVYYWRSQQPKEQNDYDCTGCGITLVGKRANAVYCTTQCYNMHKKYSIGLNGFNSLLTSQNGVCAICKTDDWGKRGPVIDHDHATGRIRGILCLKCNTSLGGFKDDIQLLQSAKAYLE